MSKSNQNAVCIFGAGFMIKQLKQLQAEIDGALDGRDIEYIHRMRVASRRLRNGMACFKDCLPKKKSKPWRDEIRRITHALGSARDLDIQIDCLNKLYDDSLDTSFKAGYRRVLLRLKQRRSKAQSKVTKTLNRLKESDILAEMQSRMEKLAAHSDDTYLYTPSLYQRAFKNINTHLEAFLSYQDDIRNPEQIEKLHAMRIAGKQLRYTIEIFSPIYDKALLPFTQVMKELQDQLGSIHDDDVWISWLPKFIEEEQARVEDYFGNLGPLKTLLPGINHLIENRQKDRDEIYQSFIATWDTLTSEDAWETLKEIIQAPIDVEAVLEHLVVEDEEMPEEINKETSDTSQQTTDAPEDQLANSNIP
jgi:CHAD domain-containing protein